MDKAAKKLAEVASIPRHMVANGPGLKAVTATAADMQPLAAAVMEVVTDAAKQAAKEVTQYASDHPYVTACIVGGVLVALAPQAATVPMLNAVGFSAEGVVATAAAHSNIGNAVAGSVFSTLQSAGAGGAGAAVADGAASMAGTAVAGAAAGAKFWARSKAKL
ncbi:hypothetical protein C8A01DRAFT_31716 [Parachaetomium inaequale]|uniref:Uncharacterized protein n=1 Tax=Parachaetomium inaequale TaxID=2588326 RepID=A0AAN6PSJ5_9PEZI|nr:hypothetical protein C8A01DRAFT_31716 [Parachaetomium inaequale]